MAKVRMMRFVFLCGLAALVLLFGFLFVGVIAKMFLFPFAAGGGISAGGGGFSFALTRRSIIIAAVLVLTAIGSLISSLVRALQRRHLRS